jgi:hypothetical protein
MTVPVSKLRFRNQITRVFPRLTALWERFQFARLDLRRYELEGFGGALPPILKRATIRKCVLHHGLTTFVETGTYLGDTPWRLRDLFGEIHTIELSPVLATLAKQRFKSFPKIHVYEGDAGEIISEVVQKLSSPTCFWLDSHWSAGFTARAKVNCPIFSELEGIFLRCRVPYAILVDDAADFSGANGYPTLDSLKKFILGHNSQLRVFVENNIVFAVPPGHAETA